MTTNEKRSWLKSVLAGKVKPTDIPGEIILRHWYGYNDGVWYNEQGEATTEDKFIVGRNIINMCHVSSGFRIATCEEDVDLTPYEGTYPRKSRAFTIKDFICEGR